MARRRAARGAPRRGRTKGSAATLLGLALAGGALVAVVVLARWESSPRPAALPPSTSEPQELTSEPAAAPARHPDDAPRARDATPTATAPSAGAPVGQLQGGRGEEGDGVRPATSSPPSPTSNATDGPPPPRRPRVAIVVDDCGQQLDLLQRAVRLRQPLTFAVIPKLPHSRASAEAAHAAGHEVIVHQPMEPEPGADPGAGALRVGMSRRRVTGLLRESLADVPHAAGVNNHMGSRATADAELMDATLAAIRELSVPKTLYFLDSRTTAATVAVEAARRHGVPAAERAVFLDNDLAPEAVRARLEELLSVARRDGSAVGIGHLKPETLTVLEETLPTADDVAFVFLSAIVR